MPENTNPENPSPESANSEAGSMDKDDTAELLRKLRGAYARTAQEEREKQEAKEARERYIAQLEGEVARRTTALQVAERRLRVLIRATAQMVWIADADGRVLEVEGWTELTGRPASDITDRKLVEVLHPDEIETVQAAWRASVEMGAPYTIEHRLRVRSGEYEKFSVRAVPLLNETGEIIEWIGMTTSLSFRAERPPDSATVDGREVAGVIIKGLLPHAGIGMTAQHAEGQKIEGQKIEGQKIEAQQGGAL